MGNTRPRRPRPCWAPLLLCLWGCGSEEAEPDLLGEVQGAPILGQGARPLAAPEAGSPDRTLDLPPNFDPDPDWRPPIAASDPGDPPQDSSPPTFVSWDILASFEYEMLSLDELLEIEDTSLLGDLEERFPLEILEFDGRAVEVEGYMVPFEYDDEGIFSFTLVRDQAMCCFGSAPRMNHWVSVVMNDDGRAEPANMEPIVVRGTLSVGERVADGYLQSLYRIRADDVELSY